MEKTGLVHEWVFRKYINKYIAKKGQVKLLQALSCFQCPWLFMLFFLNAQPYTSEKTLAFS